MAKKSKKTAAKKKNEKKNKERAALARKEVVEQKKTAQATGSEIKKTPQKPKTAADHKKDKQRAKQEKAKEKQRLKEKQEKEKREAAQKKRQEKIQKLKDREKKAEQVKKKGREEPTQHSVKKANKEKTAQTKADKPKEQKKTQAQKKPATVLKPESETAPAVINRVAETETEAVSAKIVLTEENIPKDLAPVEEVMNDSHGVPGEMEPVEDHLATRDSAHVAQQDSLSIADLVRSALSKPEETTQDIETTEDVTDEIATEGIAQPETSDITKNPIANLVHSALFKAIEPVEETVADNNTETTQANNMVEEKVLEPPPVKKQKPEKPKKESGPKKPAKATAANFTTRRTSVVKEKSEKMSLKARQAVMIVAAGVVLLAVVAIGVSIFSYNPPEKAVPEYKGITEVSVNVRDIEAEPEQQLQKAKDTKAKGDTRAFKFFANNEFMIEEWYDQFPLILGNPDTNKCDFIVTILNDDTIVYRSMGIRPGKYLPSIKLFDTMPYGTYELRVVVAGYDPVTFKNIGVQHMKFKLVIGNEQGTQETVEQTGE
ncbi:MAG: hypothetical protein GXZ02_11345 [Clostridiales bacterium]|nr:hypothetical protein [Clostridiales bacterium]